MSVESWSIVSRVSVESWSIVGRVSVDIRSPVGRESDKLSAEYRSIFRRRTSVIVESPSLISKSVAVGK